MVPRELSRLVASCPRGQAAASLERVLGKGSRPTKYPVPQRGCSAALSTTAEDHIATRRAPDRSRGVRISVSILGIVCCVIMTLTFREKSLGLLFGLAFSLAWWSEVARRLPVLMALGAGGHSLRSGVSLGLGGCSLFIGVRGDVALRRQ